LVSLAFEDQDFVRGIESTSGGLLGAVIGEVVDLVESYSPPPGGGDQGAPGSGVGGGSDDHDDGSNGSGSTTSGGGSDDGGTNITNEDLGLDGSGDPIAPDPPAETPGSGSGGGSGQTSEPDLEPDETPSESASDNQSENAVQPIVIDLDEDGIEIAISAEVLFDVDNDGFLEATSWAAADDGFLVIDLNADGTRGFGDGKIDQTDELVLSNWGNQGDTDLQALGRAFDDNSDDVIDASDAVWSELRVWQDLNQNGITDEGELHTLSDLEFTSISVVYDDGEPFPNEWSKPKNAIWFADLASDNDDSDYRREAFGNGLLGVSSIVRSGEVLTGVVGDLVLQATQIGYRVEEADFGFAIEYEDGEFNRVKVFGENSEDDDFDLNQRVFAAAYGNDAANILTAAGANWNVEIDGGAGDDSVAGGGSDDILAGG
jgi:hypothetical protein